MSSRKQQRAFGTARSKTHVRQFREDRSRPVNCDQCSSPMLSYETVDEWNGKQLRIRFSLCPPCQTSAIQCTEDLPYSLEKKLAEELVGGVFNL